MKCNENTLFLTLYVFGILILTAVFMLAMLAPVEGQTLEEVQAFLINDTTDTHEYLPWYTCGHFSRELVYNASLNNITLGSVIVGHHPTLRGFDNHIMNYFTHNDTIYVIEPQNDNIEKIDETMFGYYRLYPDGSQVPTFWNCNLASQII